MAKLKYWERDASLAERKEAAERAQKAQEDAERVSILHSSLILKLRAAGVTESQIDTAFNKMLDIDWRRLDNEATARRLADEVIYEAIDRLYQKYGGGGNHLPHEEEFERLWKSCRSAFNLWRFLSWDESREGAARKQLRREMTGAGEALEMRLREATDG
jgi:hypothetical protein